MGYSKKVYKKELHGCYWCPNHEELDEGDTDKQGYCQVLTTNVSKFIRKDEMYVEDHPQNNYYKFPDWCPLENA